MTTPTWALKVGAVVIATATLGSSYSYAATHVKNPLAPLQPAVADRPPQPADENDPYDEIPLPIVLPTAPPTRSPAPTVRPSASGRILVVTVTPPPTAAPRTAAPTVGPRLALAPAVRPTKLPAIANTHAS